MSWSICFKEWCLLPPKHHFFYPHLCLFDPRSLCLVHPITAVTPATFSQPIASTSLSPAAFFMSTPSISCTRVTSTINTPVATVIVQNKTAKNSEQHSETSSAFSSEFETYSPNHTTFLGQIQTFTFDENEASGPTLNQNTLIINISESYSDLEPVC